MPRRKVGRLIACSTVLLTVIGVTTLATAGAVSSSASRSSTVVGLGHFACVTRSGQTRCHVTSAVSLASGDYVVSLIQFRWPGTCTVVSKGIKDLVPGQTLSDLRYPSNDGGYPMLLSVGAQGGTLSATCTGGGADVSYPYGEMLTAAPATV
jgi:hypothetical protein